MLFGNAESELISIKQLVQTRYAKPTDKLLEDLSSLLVSFHACLPSDGQVQAVRQECRKKLSAFQTV